MANSFYNATGNPATGSAGLSATVRAEFAAIAVGFALLPTFSVSNPGWTVRINNAGTALIVDNALTFDSSSNATFSNKLTAPAFVPNSSTVPTNGMYLSAANVLGFAINGASGLLLSATALTVQGSVVFTGAATGLTGTAAALSIGGNAATATSATSATTATTATNVGLTSSSTNGAFNVLFAATAASGPVLYNASGLTFNPSTSAFTIAGLTTMTGGFTSSAASTVNGLLTVGAAAFTSKNTLTYGTTTTINCALSNSFRVVMTGNITTLTITNPNDGQTLVVRFKQDATGGRTVAWPASFRWASGATPVLSVAASALDLLNAQYDATDATWVCSLLKGVQ